MQNQTHPSRAPRAFTLVELMVVIAIIVVISAFLLPAFTRIIESSNFTAAINSVSATLGNARSRAISTGRPTGVAFLFDAKEEQYTLVVLEAASLQAGVLTNCAPKPGVEHYAQGLRPATNSVTVVLPPRTGVFGFPAYLPQNFDVPMDDCMSGVTTHQWYAGDLINGSDADPTNDVPLWLFPRNDGRLFTPAAPQEVIGADPWEQLTSPPPTPDIASDQEALAAIRNATSFCVLFAADGTVQLVERTGGREYANFYMEFPDEPYNHTADELEPYDDPNRFDPENFGRPTVPNDQRRPNPEVMLRCVSQIAVVDLRRMGEGVGLPRAWLARAEDSKAPQPEWLTDPDINRVANYVDDERVRAVSRWIDRNAEILGFNRYTGTVIRRSAQ